MAIVADLNAVNEDVIRIMRALYSDRLVKILLYGSYAQGDFHDESDVDYLIVLTDEKMSALTEVRVTRPVLNTVFRDSSIDVSVLVVSNEKMASSNWPFHKEVRKDGKVIYERRAEFGDQAERFLTYVKTNYAS